jgi:hypothetical protein
MPIKVAIDQGANQRVLRRLQDQGVVELRQANELEQTWRDVSQQGKGSMLVSADGRSRSRLDGPDGLADEEVVREIERIVGAGKWADVAHVYAAHLNGCEYFVTENPDDFIRDGRKEQLERLLGVKIRRTDELVQEIAND